MKSPDMDTVQLTIHVDYPVNMATEWMVCRQTGEISFHLVSGMSVSEDSRMMWAREEIKLEMGRFSRTGTSTNSPTIESQQASLVRRYIRTPFLGAIEFFSLSVSASASALCCYGVRLRLRAPIVRRRAPG